MADVRTTIAIKEDLYLSMKSQYRALGFTRLGDFVNQAIDDFLKRSQVEVKDQLMAEAAEDSNYRALIRQIGQDLVACDADGLRDDY